jgi:5'-3' exonuclease
MNNAFYKSYSIYKSIYKDLEKINEKLLFNKFLIDFGFTIRLFKKSNKIEKVICCYDSKESFRKRLSKTYKSNRQKQDDAFYSVLGYSSVYLEDLGFIVACVEDLEADDLVGIWARHLKDEVNCIISNDEDVRQLLDTYVVVYNNQSKNKKIYRAFDSFYLTFLLDDYESIVEDPHWVLFKKMILGCDSDLVKKLLRGRIGEKKLKERLFDKIEFNKDYINDYDLERISLRINETFKDEQVLIKELDENLSLVNLCTNVYYSDKVNEEIKNMITSSKFTYNDSYQFI